MMKGRIQSQPLLLVQSTSGGKSAVPQTCGSAVPGVVTIVIENTLALCADQVSKFDKLEAEGSHIFTIQLDQFKSRPEQQYVIDTMGTYSFNISLITEMAMNVDSFWDICLFSKSIN